MEPGVHQAATELENIFQLIKELSQILPKLMRQKNECAEFDCFLEDVESILRSKVTFPLIKSREKYLLGQLFMMRKQLREAQTLLIELAIHEPFTRRVILPSDRILPIRLEILKVLSFVSLLFRPDESDLDDIIEHLKPPTSTSAALQQGSAQVPPPCKPPCGRQENDSYLRPHRCHWVNGHATWPFRNPCIPALTTTTSPGEVLTGHHSLSPPWERVKELGRGGFGTVWLAKDSRERFFAMKEFHLDQGTDLNGPSFERDHMKKLQELDHQHIVRYLGVETNGGMLCIFMELAGKRSLRSLYLAQSLQISQVKEFTRQILEALRYVHSRHIVHRDVKCDNIVVDDYGTCKLCDFGVARQLISSKDLAKTQAGSTRWMAPEIIRPFHRKEGGSILGYRTPADIWSLGCTVLEMTTGDIPYAELTNNFAVMFQLAKSRRSPKIPENLPEVMKDFLSRCLKEDPTERDSAENLLQHPFITGYSTLGDLWKAELARLENLSHPELKGHAVAVAKSNLLRFARLKSFSQCA